MGRISTSRELAAVLARRLTQLQSTSEAANTLVDLNNHDIVSCPAISAVCMPWAQNVEDMIFLKNIPNGASAECFESTNDAIAIPLRYPTLPNTYCSVPKFLISSKSEQIAIMAVAESTKWQGKANRLTKPGGHNRIII